MIVLIYEVLVYYNSNPIISAAAASTSFNSPGKGDMPIAELPTINTIGYWLALASTTDNAYSYPSYLSGIPRTKILPDLISCESRGKTTALNPVDLDGTASYGLLEFKPRTLWSEAIRYGLIPTSTPKSVLIIKGNPRLETNEQRDLDIRYNAQLQVDVASHMIMDNWKDPAFWLQQFPGCYAIYHTEWGIN